MNGKQAKLLKKMAQFNEKEEAFELMITDKQAANGSKRAKRAFLSLPHNKRGELRRDMSDLCFSFRWLKLLRS